MSLKCHNLKKKKKSQININYFNINFVKKIELNLWKIDYCILYFYTNFDCSLTIIPQIKFYPKLMYLFTKETNKSLKSLIWNIKCVIKWEYEIKMAISKNVSVMLFCKTNYVS